jgi:tellurite resistance protein TehA-like permease
LYSHLTEFAILFQQSDAGSACSSTLFGLIEYLIFLLAYLCVSVLTIIQLVRIARYRHAASANWLMPVEHALVLTVAVMKAFNMLLFYKLYAYIDFTLLSIVSGLPLLFTSIAPIANACMNT